MDQEVIVTGGSEMKLDHGLLQETGMLTSNGVRDCDQNGRGGC
jgi:hypothetical protein